MRDTRDIIKESRTWEEAWDLATMGEQRRFYINELMGYLGEFADDYDIEGLTDALTYIDPRTGNRCWEPRFLNDEEAFRGIVECYDKTLIDGPTQADYDALEETLGWYDESTSREENITWLANQGKAVAQTERGAWYYVADDEDCPKGHAYIWDDMGGGYYWVGGENND